MSKTFHATTALALALGFTLLSAPAYAQLALAPASPGEQVFQGVINDEPEAEEAVAYVPAHLQRTVVSFATNEAPGTVIIDTPNTYLYYVLGGGRAIRYGIGVGREGFTWAGVKSVERKAEWPDWTPPAEMIARQPYLPRFMAGGPGNPMGARAMYLGGSLYRIHGTNQPSSIGKRVSSGCIRMLNADVADLYSRVNVGTKVVVLNSGRRAPPTEAAGLRGHETLRAPRVY
ncbi:MAG: hypothetical protein QOD74_3074 [Variibacter sp.]|jgi:lipoprotein-anchoring transpeptidase ErfK/SrfK|nr:hypothetical protein [Variibacter sp.]